MYFRKFQLKIRVFVLAIFAINTALNAQNQDVEATVSVIHPKVQITNTQIFTSLQQSISQFVNQRLWCSDKVTSIEKFKITLFKFKLGLYLTFSNKNLKDARTLTPLYISGLQYKSRKPSGSYMQG
jgi:hypothetical protein